MRNAYCVFRIPYWASCVLLASLLVVVFGLGLRFLGIIAHTAGDATAHEMSLLATGGALNDAVWVLSHSGSLPLCLSGTGAGWTKPLGQAQGAQAARFNRRRLWQAIFRTVLHAAGGATADEKAQVTGTSESAGHFRVIFRTGYNQSLRSTEAGEPVVFVHTTQADFMAGERDHLDARGLDALGTPYIYDLDARGFLRLRSQPGTWTKHPDNPVFDTGVAGQWDATVVDEAKVVFDGKTFHLWYTGRNRDEPPAGRHKAPMRIGYATSPDGVHWTRHPANPVLDVGSADGPDANIVYPPFVLFDGEIFRMWYSAHNFERWSINYATSPDGVHWTRHPQNPLMVAERDGRWDENYISEPAVLFNGQQFEMWYNGGSDRTGELRVGYASSPDGLTWTRRAEDRWVLDIGPAGSWDDFSVARAHVIFDGERYQMWHEGHDGRSWRIGYATSDDGVNWRPGPGDPILDLGPAGAWDSVHVAEPYVLFDGQLYWLWYSGYDSDKYRIGLTTAPPVYSTRGVFTSTIVDAGATVNWSVLQWMARVPEGTGLELAVRVSPDGQAWSEWVEIHQVSVDGDNVASLTVPPARFFQYRAILTTDDPAQSPVLEEVRALAQPPTPMPAPTVTPSPIATPVPTAAPTLSPTPTLTPAPAVASVARPAGLVIAALIGALIGGLVVVILLHRR